MEKMTFSQYCNDVFKYRADLVIERRGFNIYHYGDCTNQSCPCDLCMLERALKEYRKYTNLKALQGVEVNMASFEELNNNIVGRLINFEKYKFVDKSLISEIASDIFNNLNFTDDFFICERCKKIIRKLDASKDNKYICDKCSLLPF
jgi:hypothetical protein